MWKTYFYIKFCRKLHASEKSIDLEKKLQMDFLVVAGSSTIYIDKYMYIAVCVSVVYRSYLHDRKKTSPATIIVSSQIDNNCVSFSAIVYRLWYVSCVFHKACVTRICSVVQKLCQKSGINVFSMLFWYHTAFTTCNIPLMMCNQKYIFCIQNANDCAIKCNR